MTNLIDLTNLDSTGGTPDFDPADLPMRQAIGTLMNMMRMDYGALFTSQFPKEEKARKVEVNAWKHRILKKVRGLYPSDLLDGYDDLLTQNPEYLPKIPELVAATLRRQKQRLKDEANQVEAERIALMPPKPEISESVAKQNLAKIREMLGKACDGMEKRETEDEKAARLVKLKVAIANHDAELDKAFPHRHREYVPKPEHECAVGYCTRPGVVSGSTKGDGKFYCSEHFRRE